MIFFYNTTYLILIIVHNWSVEKFFLGWFTLIKDLKYRYCREIFFDFGV